MSTGTQIQPARRAGTAIALRKALETIAPRLSCKPSETVNIVAAMAYNNPSLLECELGSILKSVEMGDKLGLSFSPTLGEAYLVPRFNGKLGASECHFEPGYKGLVKLAKMSGEVEDIYASPVYEGDDFAMENAPVFEIYHRNTAPFQSGRKLDGVYAIAYLKTGRKVGVALTMDEILGAMKRSQSGKKGAGPWSTDFVAMAQKTALRQLCKRHLSLGPAYHEAIAADDAQYTEASVVSAPPEGISPARHLADRLRDRRALQAPPQPAADDVPSQEELDADQVDVEDEPGADG